MGNIARKSTVRLAVTRTQAYISGMKAGAIKEGGQGQIEKADTADIVEERKRLRTLEALL